MNKQKASNILTLKADEPALKNFAEGLYELYDIDRDGEDWWTAYQFSDGSYADVNIYAYENERCTVRTITITAYPVGEDGETLTNNYLRLLTKRFANNNTTEGM
jgi:hypothetical protein